LDDGSKSREESVAMLQMAAGSGTTDIVATPHCDLEYAFEPDLIRQRVEELTALTGGAPRIHEGCDFHLTYDNVQDAIANPGKYTIGHKSYLLVEFSDLLIFKNCSEIFGNLLNAGIRPVITHPERNRLLQQRLDKLRQWVIEGCYLQVTAGSLLGNFGNTARRFSLELIKENLVHFIASDAHDTRHRTTAMMKQAYDWVVETYNEEYARSLFVDNPAAALAGEPLKPYQAHGLLRPKRKWYDFFGRS
jgi:protein-tyrosine phosphatase